MLRKACTLSDLKLLEEGSGGFSGYASTTGNKDLAGEIVCKGAFDKHLEKFLAEGFGAVGHDWAGLPVATPRSAHEDAKGLFTEFDFHSTDEAQKARTYVRERQERGKSVGLSIGYTLRDSEHTKAGRLLKEIELHEVSIVTVPCNPQAQATGVKDAKAVYLGDYAAESMTLAALRNCYDSLFYSALYDILFDWNGDRSLDEKITEATAAIDEARSLCVNALRALMTAAGDEDAKAELEAEFKTVFSVPARVTGRLNERLAQALTDQADLIDRLKSILPLRQADGRTFPDERWDQIQAIKSGCEALLSARVTERQSETSLLQLQAQVERERLKLALACGGA